MKKYDCIQDSSTAARSRRNGRIGEKLAAQVLARHGFRHIENLNERRMNHKYADLYAEKGGVRYVISVKARNKYTASGTLNPSYNLIQGGEVAFASEAEESNDAIAAWVVVALEDTIFDAYFGLLSSLSNARSIPMTPRATQNYCCLAQDEDPLEFKNQYQRRPEAQVFE